MAIDKTINLKTTLDEKGLNELESGLKRVDKEQKNVSSSAKKAGASVDDLASNGGAIAILDSLTGGLATKLKDTYEAAKLFNFSLKGTRTALIATGIGAFVVALGLVVAYWDEIVEFITGANEALEEQHTALTQNLSLIDSELTLLKKKEKYNDDNGISNVENLKKQKEILLEKQKLIAEDVKILEAQLLKEQSVASELSLYQKFQLAIGNVPDLTLIDEEERKRIIDLQKQINALKGDAIETNQALIDIDKPKELEPVKDKTVRGQVESVDGGFTSAQLNELKVESEFTDAKNEIRAKGIEDSINQETHAAYIRQKIAEEEARYKEQEYRNNYNNLQNILSVGGKKMNKISKALAIADVARTAFQSISETVSSTAAANAKAVAASPLTGGMPFVAINTVKAALSIGSTLASSAKSIQAIKGDAQNVSSSGNLPTANGGGASAPSFNVVGTSGTNQLAQSLQQQQAPIQAYVVGSNVTTQQELDRNIVDTVTLG